MKRLLGITLLTAVFCTSVSAQEARSQIKVAFDVGSERSKAAEGSRPVGSLFTPPSIRILDGRSPSVHYAQSTEPLRIDEPKFVVKDGAVYLSVFGQVLIPLAGGGASGCFSHDLSERIRRLQSVIERFPPHPRQGPADRR